MGLLNLCEAKDANYALFPYSQYIIYYKLLHIRNSPVVNVSINSIDINYNFLIDLLNLFHHLTIVNLKIILVSVVNVYTSTTNKVFGGANKINERVGNPSSPHLVAFVLDGAIQ